MPDDIVEIGPNNIDEYYKKVNKAVDEYFEKHKVRPGSLKRYLKPKSKGLKLFIEKYKLSNVKNIDKVILDVLNDRVGMVDDGVLTFEHFKLHEDYNPQDNPRHDVSENWLGVLLNDIEKPESPMEYKKIIADYYRTSLGHISELNEDRHEYKVDDRYGEKDVFILSPDDIVIIRDTIVSHTLAQLEKLTFDDFLTDIYVSDLTLEGLIDHDQFSKGLKDKLPTGDGQFRDQKRVTNIITDHIEAQDYSPKGEFKGYYLWER